LDNNATTQPDDAVVQAMLPSLQNRFGNPSSLHQLGQEAAHATELARRQVANLIHVRPNRIVFTSSGTEAIHLAMRGIIEARPDKQHLITTAVEHDATLRLSEYFETQGHAVTYLGVDSKGRLDLQALRDAIRPETTLISIMYANNETGTIFPIREIVALAKEHRIPIHVDGVQALGKIPVDLETLGVDLFSMSAHKLHGPKGIGALYVNRTTKLTPMFYGGHQETDRRAGTENVPGIVGFAAAAERAAQLPPDQHARIAHLRDRLEQGILDRIDRTHALGDLENRVENTTLIAFEALEAEAILLTLSENGIYASSGAACSSGSLEPSHVLAAMGIDPIIAHGAIRFSLSRQTTESEIEQVLERLPAMISRVRAAHQDSTQTASIGQE
jgi:cysteine desulfurase